MYSVCGHRLYIIYGVVHCVSVAVVVIESQLILALCILFTYSWLLHITCIDTNTIVLSGPRSKLIMVKLI